MRNAVAELLNNSDRLLGSGRTFSVAQLVYELLEKHYAELITEWYDCIGHGTGIRQLEHMLSKAHEEIASQRWNLVTDEEFVCLQATLWREYDLYSIVGLPHDAQSLADAPEY